jgi:hypothetical protein
MARSIPVFGRRSGRREEGVVHQLDIDPAILHRLCALAISTSLRAAAGGSSNGLRGMGRIIPQSAQGHSFQALDQLRPSHLSQEKAMTTLENTEVPCTELSDAELSEVSAGKSKGFVQFGDIKGECTDKDHKDW